jgi:hypothetical protein
MPVESPSKKELQEIAKLTHVDFWNIQKSQSGTMRDIRIVPVVTGLIGSLTAMDLAQRIQWVEALL